MMGGEKGKGKLRVGLCASFFGGPLRGKATSARREKQKEDREKEAGGVRESLRESGESKGWWQGARFTSNFKPHLHQSEALGEGEKKKRRL